MCAAGHYGEDCASQYCAGYFGRNGSVVECGGHGSCTEKRKCACDQGYTGAQCFDMTCASNCSSTATATRGACYRPPGETEDACRCAAGFNGATCQFSGCHGAVKVGNSTLECGGHGACNHMTNKCQCAEGYLGLGCERNEKCVDGCINGICTSGICKCFLGATGSRCDKPTCGFESKCNGHGECVDEKKGLGPRCQCAPAYTGATCESKKCPVDENGATCSNHGLCNDQAKCSCEDGWSGKNCELSSCPRLPAAQGSLTCSGHGACPKGTGICKCAGGYMGRTCTQKTCPSNKKVRLRSFVPPPEGEEETTQKPLVHQNYTSALYPRMLCLMKAYQCMWGARPTLFPC